MRNPIILLSLVSVCAATAMGAYEDGIEVIQPIAVADGAGRGVQARVVTYLRYHGVGPDEILALKIGMIDDENFLPDQSNQIVNRNAANLVGIETRPVYAKSESNMVFFGDTLRVEFDFSRLDTAQWTSQPWKYVGENVIQTTFDCIFRNAQWYESDWRPLNWLDIRVIGPEEYKHYEGIYPVQEEGM